MRLNHLAPHQLTKRERNNRNTIIRTITNNSASKSYFFLLAWESISYQQLSSNNPPLCCIPLLLNNSLEIHFHPTKLAFTQLGNLLQPLDNSLVFSLTRTLLECSLNGLGTSIMEKTSHIPSCNGGSSFFPLLKHWWSSSSKWTSSCPLHHINFALGARLLVHAWGEPCHLVHKFPSPRQGGELTPQCTSLPH